MEIKEYIKESLRKLDTLGIPTSHMEDKIMNAIMSTPPDMLQDMAIENILGLILDYVGSPIYDVEINEYKMESEQVYSFDVEVPYPDIMYTVFLNFVNKLTGEDIVISDITEDTDHVNYQEGNRTKVVHFSVNGKQYQYEAEVHYDWFDMRFIHEMNQILQEYNVAKSLYVTSDSWQNCILFYNTELWAKRYQKAFPESKLEKA